MRRGFTLVETVVVIGVTAFILLALTNLYLTFTRLYAYEQTFVPAAESAAGGMNAIADAVLTANRVLSEYAFSGATYTSGTTTLVLETPALDASGRIIPEAYDHIAFYLDGTDLYRLLSSDPGSARGAGTKRVAREVSALTFTYDALPAEAASVDADLTVRLFAGEQTVTNRLHQKTYLRND